MKKWFLIPLSAMMMAFTISNDTATDCKGYMSVEKGVTYTYENYDQKNKLSGSSESTVTSVTELDGIISATVHAVQKDPKGKIESEGDVNFTCQNGEIKMDMKSLMNPEQMEGFKDATVTIEQTNLSFPSTLTEGQSLPDGKMTMKIDMSGFVMTMIIDVIERKVEKFEPIETTAGTFQCVKISQKIVSDMGMMKTTTKSVSWFALGIGSVRTESYNSNGELMGYTILSKITKP